MFSLRVRVCTAPDGRVFSNHEFYTHEDEVAACGLPNSGVAHVAHGLLLEAAKREAYATALIQQSGDPEFLPQYKGADLEGQDEVGRILSNQVYTVMGKTLQKIIPGSVKSVLRMLSS